VKKGLAKGMAHITGGGFIENIPRVLPETAGVQIERIWPVPEIFNFLCEAGKVGKRERYRVFNMGIGMIVIIDQEDLSKVEGILNSLNEKYYLIGQVTERKGKEQIKIK
jgi:phosphoribosylformylglycinamidine cyclo-ligase